MLILLSNQMELSQPWLLALWHVWWSARLSVSYVSVCLCHDCVYVCLSVCRFVCHSVCMFICLSVGVRVCFCGSAYLGISLFICLSVCLCISTSACY
jgi:hypothetical protein